MEIQHIFDSGANEMRIFNMIEMFLDRRDKAINYTRCCCKLKDKESQAFEDWIDFEGYRDEYNDLLSNGFAYDIGLLHKKHNEFLKHSL